MAEMRMEKILFVVLRYPANKVTQKRIRYFPERKRGTSLSEQKMRTVEIEQIKTLYLFVVFYYNSCFLCKPKG